MLTRKFSKITIILTIVAALLFPAIVHGAGFNRYSTNINQPQIEILSTTSETIELRVRFPANPIFTNTDGPIFDENIYTHPSEVSVPDLPVIRESIELPFGSEYSLEILDTISRTGQLGENGLPNSIPDRAPEVEKSNPLQTDEDPNNNETNAEALFPASPAQLVQTYIIRGHKVGQVQLWPVVYDSNQQTVEIYEEITFRINIQQADLNLTAERSSSIASPTFDRLLSSQILNYSGGVSIESDRTKGNEPIMVIAPDAFLSTLDALVSLKQNQGHPVTLVPLSTTGNTPESIKSYISNAYHNSTSPPTYVILVGDVNNGANTMPAFIGLSSDSVTDLYYGTVDGNDWIPDIFVGRLPARDTTQLNTMINNLAAYNNLTGTEEWVKKAAFLASNDSTYWQVAENTQNYVIQSHTQPNGYVGTFPSSPQAGGDKLFAYSYSAGNSEVINAINNSRALIAYTGHGSRTSWGGPSYSQSNIRNISQSGIFSVVTSFACDTGDFNTTESFGETWLIQQNKGAVAFIGSSSSSFWGPDDTLERAMMDSLYSGFDSANLVSSFLYNGLMSVEATRPGTGTAQSRYYWEIYNLLGDPSLEMLIEPKAIPDYLPRFNTSSVSASQAPGQEVTVELELTNAGSQADTYILDLVSTDWVSRIKNQETIALASGETKILEITVTIPLDATLGLAEEIYVYATSSDDPGLPAAEDTAIIELKAYLLSFIPIITSQ